MVCGIMFKNLLKSLSIFSIFILKRKPCTALRGGGGGGGARTPDLRITSAPSPVYDSTAYKYDALTVSATGAW